MPHVTTSFERLEKTTTFMYILKDVVMIDTDSHNVRNLPEKAPFPLKKKSKTELFLVLG